MAALGALILMVYLSLLVVRVAAVALTLTGLSREAAKFQARSAWTGTGFTTQEAEEVVSHPVRRKIISILMLIRNAGFVAALSTLLLSFMDAQGGQGWLRFAILMVALLLLWFIARSDWFDRHLSRLIAWALKRWTDIDTRDYADLLHLVGEYAIAEVKVRADGWLADRTLADLDLTDEGVLVLGVQTLEGQYVGAPGPDTRLRPGETVLLYGRSPTLAQLDRRMKDEGGREARHQALDEQRRAAGREGHGARNPPQRRSGGGTE